MIRGLISGLVSGLISPLISITKRWAYNFDGVDDRGQLAFRAINPDADIDIEWYQEFQEANNTANGVIVAQCGTGTNSTQEFRLTYLSAGRTLELIVGGAQTTALAEAPKRGKYRITLVGSQLTVWVDGAIVRSTTFNRGAARESSAPLWVGARQPSLNFFPGFLRDLRVNGRLYPMGDRNQVVQLPWPTGLGDELITQSRLENPATKGSQWTYLGDGRWQLVGDGSFNELMIVASGSQPQSGYIEFEVESISGGAMRCYTTTNGIGTLQSNPVFDKPGTFRHFYIDKAGLGGNTQYFAFVRVNGSINCIIKNISFKPLGTCNPMTLVNTASTGWTQVDGQPLPLLRWAYNFDGVDDLGTFNTPIELGQDFDVQITVEDIQQVPAAGQDFIGSELNFKFGLDAVTGRFSFLVGNGSSWVVNHLSSVSAYDGKRYVLRGTKVGNTYTFTINGEVSFTTTNANVVTPRVTHIARRSNGNLSWVRGRVFDVKINGTIYAIDARNQLIQLPSPTGLGSEVLPTDTLFVVPSGFDNTIISSATGFSVTKGSTASRVAKAFPAPSSSYLLEFNLDSIDAGTTVACFIRDGSTAGVGTIITSISSAQLGKNRLLFNRISGDANILFVSNVAANFVVNAVTIRQLGTCNPLTLSNTASTGWQEIEA